MSRKVDSQSERLAVVMAARRKWNDRFIALTELNGVFQLKSLTGKWELDTSVNPPFARDKSIVYWTGSSFEEAKKAVK